MTKDRTKKFTSDAELQSRRILAWLGVTAACVLVLALCAVLLLHGTQPPVEVGRGGAKSAFRVSLLETAEPMTASAVPNVELLDVSEGMAQGKLLLVHDPKTVVLAVTEPLGYAPGMQITDLVDSVGGIAGINAGGYADDNGRSNGGTPVGLVIADGELRWGPYQGAYHVVGLDGEGKLIVGIMSAAEALDRGMRWGVSFVSFEGNAAELIIDGQVQTYNLGAGINPRTAIGQREDGTLLLLVLDGRGFESLGASMENICDVMLKYGAVTAGNLDGGASSVMAYEGQIVNQVNSITGPRSIPTAFVVLGEGESDGG